MGFVATARAFRTFFCAERQEVCKERRGWCKQLGTVPCLRSVGRRCNAMALEKWVLDCGAGGDDLPLSLFCQYGYQTHGIEIAESALVEANRFCREKRMPSQKTVK